MDVAKCHACHAKRSVSVVVVVVGGGGGGGGVGVGVVVGVGVGVGVVVVVCMTGLDITSMKCLKGTFGESMGFNMFE